MSIKKRRMGMQSEIRKDFIPGVGEVWIVPETEDDEDTILCKLLERYVPGIEFNEEDKTIKIPKSVIERLKEQES